MEPGTSAQLGIDHNYFPASLLHLPKVPGIVRLA